MKQMIYPEFDIPWNHHSEMKGEAQPFALLSKRENKTRREEETGNFIGPCLKHLFKGFYCVDPAGLKLTRASASASSNCWD